MTDRAKEEWKKKRQPKPASSSDDDGHRANDENPTHREDFNSLLGAAVRTPELKD